MNRTIQSGLAATALMTLTATAMAADLGGSLKDGYVPQPVYAPPVAGASCYFRAGTGYSWSREPSVDWTGTTFANTSYGSSWLGEAAVGCGSGTDRGLRGELAFTGRGSKSFSADITSTPSPNITGDPAHTSVTNYTAMFNAYYDLGNLGGFVPYVGAGVGLAYHQMDDYTLPLNGTSVPYKVSGDNDLTLAWSLMAGVGYQISDRAIESRAVKAAIGGPFEHFSLQTQARGRDNAMLHRVGPIVVKRHCRRPIAGLNDIAPGAPIKADAATLIRPSFQAGEFICHRAFLLRLVGRAQR